ncbi:hypothetical protein acdb102_31070 [Acidothermaceae bacterium B102]|nr:hypothetical protein acdb102_31070 [Acidothermaceae bacterium B102]
MTCDTCKDCHECARIEVLRAEIAAGGAQGFETAGLTYANRMVRTA